MAKGCIYFETEAVSSVSLSSFVISFRAPRHRHRESASPHPRRTFFEAICDHLPYALLVFENRTQMRWQMRYLNKLEVVARSRACRILSERRAPRERHARTCAREQSFSPPGARTTPWCAPHDVLDHVSPLAPPYRRSPRARKGNSRNAYRDRPRFRRFRRARHHTPGYRLRVCGVTESPRFPSRVSLRGVIIATAHAGTRH